MRNYNIKGITKNRFLLQALRYACAFSRNDRAFLGCGGGETGRGAPGFPTPDYKHLDLSFRRAPIAIGATEESIH